MAYSISHPNARRAFSRARRRARRRAAFAKLHGRANRPQQLRDRVPDWQTRTRAMVVCGLKMVPLAQISGSVGGVHRFDRAFFPTRDIDRERWQDLYEAWCTDKAVIPPIEVIKVGKTYYVVDGHYRLSVAHFLGETHIAVQVTELLIAAPAVQTRQLHLPTRVVDTSESAPGVTSLFTAE